MDGSDSKGKANEPMRHMRLSTKKKMAIDCHMDLMDLKSVVQKITDLKEEMVATMKELASLVVLFLC